ncbi:hypothetical protein GOV09_01925 [Candidatus Woesearchaeota archaeon]|nr:hypothetical protein [Candidatus Woesearchaeota archaeon]
MNKKNIRKKVGEFLQSNKERIEIKVPKNFSLYWVRNPIAVAWRMLILGILTKVPPMNLKNWIFKLLGYNFGKDVCLPGFIDIDPFFPELITLKEGILVGGSTTIKPWIVKDGKLTLGKIWAGRRVLFAGWSGLRPGAKIHTNTITGLHCLIDTEIPKDSFVVGHNKILKTWSTEEVERHFGESKHNPHYARNYKKETTKFRTDPSVRKITLRNDGNRLNAGCDWWRARPVWQIYWKGALVEASLLCPFEPIRKMLMWIMGVRWGKNFKLGKKVMFDHIYGDMVRFGDNCVIEDGAYFDGHDYTISEGIYGRTTIGNNFHAKKGAYVRSGLVIGNNVTLEEHAVLIKDAKDNEVWAGAPAKLVEK